MITPLRAAILGMLAALLFPSPLLAFCGGMPSDPRTGGFAGGLCGLSSGAYEKRLQQRRNELRTLEAAKADLEARLASRQAKVRALETQIAETRRRAEGRLALAKTTEEDIARLKERKAASDAELARIEAENTALSQELAGHMERARQTELASRALREGATQAGDQTALRKEDRENRADGDALDRRLADMRRRLSETANR